MEERLLRIEFTVLDSTEVQNKEINLHTSMIQQMTHRSKRVYIVKIAKERFDASLGFSCNQLKKPFRLPIGDPFSTRSNVGNSCVQLQIQVAD